MSNHWSAFILYSILYACLFFFVCSLCAGSLFPGHFTDRTWVPLGTKIAIRWCDYVDKSKMDTEDAFRKAESDFQAELDVG